MVLIADHQPSTVISWYHLWWDSWRWCVTTLFCSDTFFVAINPGRGWRICYYLSSWACDSLQGWIVICLLKGSPPFIVCISYQAPPFTAIPKNDIFSNIAVVRACWSAIICKYKYPLCIFCVFSVCVFCLCFLSVFSCCVFSLCFLLCVFSSLCFFLSSLCFQYVLSVCVFCPCFLSGFAFLSINFDIILLWSGLADQLLFADINSQFIWLQYKYKILTRYFGLSGSPASSLFFFCTAERAIKPCRSSGSITVRWE